MSETKAVRIFILGAGCSVKSGYPVGESLASQLDGFYGQIPGDCTGIQKCVRSTLNLIIGRPAIETLDQLVQDLEDEFRNWSSQKGSATGVDKNYIDTETHTDDQIRDAKIATTAMFVAKEDTTRQTGLPGYSRLVDSVFGGDPWEKAVSESDCHVLSFNYDRLFEIAFLQHFRVFDGQHIPLYEQTVLNSGFGQIKSDVYHKFQPKACRFSFLKLHGSAYWWVKRPKGANGKNSLRHYWPTSPMKLADLHEIENVIQAENDYPWEPLIVFPHEKHRGIASPTEFEHDPYIRTVEGHAISVLKSATEVRIIGYSFAPIDNRHVIDNLLSAIPDAAKIIVQNPSDSTVRARLEGYPTFRRRIERGMVTFDPTPF